MRGAAGCSEESTPCVYLDRNTVDGPGRLPRDQNDNCSTALAMQSQSSMCGKARFCKRTLGPSASCMQYSLQIGCHEVLGCAEPAWGLHTIDRPTPAKTLRYTASQLEMGLDD